MTRIIFAAAAAVFFWGATQPLYAEDCDFEQNTVLSFSDFDFLIEPANAARDQFEPVQSRFRFVKAQLNNLNCYDGNTDPQCSVYDTELKELTPKYREAESRFQTADAQYREARNKFDEALKLYNDCIYLNQWTDRPSPPSRPVADDTVIPGIAPDDPISKFVSRPLPVVIPMPPASVKVPVPPGTASGSGSNCHHESATSHRHCPAGNSATVVSQPPSSNLDRTQRGPRRPQLDQSVRGPRHPQKTGNLVHSKPVGPSSIKRTNSDVGRTIRTQHVVRQPVRAPVFVKKRR